MIAIAIIAILVGIVAWMGSRSNTDAKVKQTKAAMDAIRAAVTEYKLAGHTLMPTQPYDPDDNTPPDITLIGLFEGDPTFRADFYRERSGTEGDFGLNANGDSADGPAEGDTGRFAYSVRPENHKVPDGRRIYGIQVLYYELIKEPNSRAMVNKIPSAHVISAEKVAPGTEFLNPGTLMRKGNPADDQRATDVLVFVDAWGRPLYYQKSTRENNDEWSVRSAGPDGQWGTGDDIFSYK
jgi:type II secretory pathway pseudopilin PulG